MLVLIPERQEPALICALLDHLSIKQVILHIEGEQKTHTLAMVLADGFELKFFHISDSCGHFCPSQPSSSS